MSETGTVTLLQQVRSSAFQQLSIFHSGRADRLAGSAAKTAIDMSFEGWRLDGQSSFGDGTHKVDSSARPIIFITSGDVGWTGFKTQAAVNAGEQLFFVRDDSSC